MTPSRRASASAPLAARCTSCPVSARRSAISTRTSSSGSTTRMRAIGHAAHERRRQAGRCDRRAGPGLASRIRVVTSLPRRGYPPLGLEKSLRHVKTAAMIDASKRLTSTGLSMRQRPAGSPMFTGAYDDHREGWMTRVQGADHVPPGHPQHLKIEAHDIGRLRIREPQERQAHCRPRQLARVLDSE